LEEHEPLDMIITYSMFIFYVSLVSRKQREKLLVIKSKHEGQTGIRILNPVSAESTLG
jgi:hypothetical protein